MQGLSPEIGYRLASLADGEGCFVISRQLKNGRSTFQCSFVVKMRADDRAFLERWCKETGMGRVQEACAQQDRHRANKPSASWVVSRQADCLRLVDLFDRFPLWSKKARDFAIWSEAVRYWVDPVTVPRRGMAGRQVFVDHAPMAQLHQRLRQTRLYSAA